MLTCPVTQGEGGGQKVILADLSEHKCLQIQCAGIYLITSSWSIYQLHYLLKGGYYGVDWDGPAPHNPTDDQEAVEVPITSNPLQAADYESLKTLIDPLPDSEEYGVDIYLEALSFVHTKTANY